MSETYSYSVEPSGFVRWNRDNHTAQSDHEESSVFHLHRIATALERIAETLDETKGGPIDGEFHWRVRG